MKLLMENWRKYLTEQYTDWSTITEDDLYNFSYEELIEMRNEIQNPSPSSPYGRPHLRSLHPGRWFLPTIVARIEAIEEGEAYNVREPDREIENLYDGEFILKLLKTYWSSANQGIELASMIPGTESLLAEFKRAREQVASLIEYAEDNDDSPWMDRSANDSSESLPDEVGNSMRLLMHQVIKPEEPEDGISDDEQEVVEGYHRLIDSLAGLGQYAYHQLHGQSGGPTPHWLDSDSLIADYKFIKDWVGGE